MTKQKTLLFYCQHSTGIGHLVRALALAEELSSCFRIVFLSGGQSPPGIQLPKCIEFIQLPPVGMGAEGKPISLDGRRTVERALDLRRLRILDIFQKVQPHAILIEFYPFGRMYLSSELLSLLETAQKMGPARPMVFCSLRDIMKRKPFLQQVYDDLTCFLTNRLFDGLLIHTDPRFALLEETFCPSMPLLTPIYYTGFVASQGYDEPPTAHKSSSQVIVSAGGGRVGLPLLVAALEAYTQFGLGDGIGMTVIAGPFLPEKEWNSLREAARGVKGLKLRRWLPDFRGELSRARASVSQCGYNTSMDLICTRIPSLVVPFVGLGEKEQMYRARKLESLGIVRVLEQEQADPQRLAAEIRATLRFQPRRLEMDLNGARKTTRLIEAIVLGSSTPSTDHCHGLPKASKI